ncbi:PTS sugar transporter subunit IIA [Lactobacillus acetotolerans]|uniref:PTS sugar transporter subunit IIA n=1 Tax=Lactobacillus acetotolerans TaxID=1600 RepID=A0A5P5ZHV5_9LACO|nr:PTS sugar transporter subunit IIA [Lactobacillus acetotolerans]QFG50652.1 PTS sugar transporter subunit IIA [Lactobacillus acetotolerans]GGV12880.1 PTS sugar transporter subunit IIA [Lactobacillus acetotolerans DSM 20749 = JCM 3825]
MTQKNIFAPDAGYVSKQSDRDQVLKETYDHLRKHGYVKGNFLQHIIKREDNYPTGLDTTTLGPNLPNIAVPHTEGEFVNARLIVPVALTKPVIFKNMIKPDKELRVKFVFMLLDNYPDGQAKLLAEVMAFLAKTPVNDLRALLNMTDSNAIYDFLIKQFT